MSNIKIKPWLKNAMQASDYGLYLDIIMNTQLANKYDAKYAMGKQTITSYLKNNEDVVLFFQYYCMFNDTKIFINDNQVSGYIDTVLDNLDNDITTLDDTGALSWIHYILQSPVTLSSNQHKKILKILKDADTMVSSWVSNNCQPSNRLQLMLYTLTHIVFVITTWGSRSPWFKLSPNVCAFLKRQSMINHRNTRGNVVYVEPYVIDMELILARIYMRFASDNLHTLYKRALQVQKTGLKQVTNHAKLVSYELWHKIPLSIRRTKKNKRKKVTKGPSNKSKKTRVRPKVNDESPTL